MSKPLGDAASLAEQILALVPEDDCAATDDLATDLFALNCDEGADSGEVLATLSALFSKLPYQA